MTQTNKPPEWWEEKADDLFIEGNMRFKGIAKLTPDSLKYLIRQTLLTERENLREKIENTPTEPHRINNTTVNYCVGCISRKSVLKLLE